MKKNIICIVCPLGCDVSVEYRDNGIKGIEILEIEGNICKKGRDFVVKEIENPERVITTSIKVVNGELPLVSVRTDNPIPKGKIFEIMKFINRTQIKAPIKRNQIIIKNILDLDVNIISTRTVDVCDKKN